VIQRTLALIKPDGVRKGAFGAIKDRYQNAGLKIIVERVGFLSEDVVVNLYQEHCGKFYFDALVLAMISGPVVALLLEGEDAVAVVRKLNGATDPAKAEPGTIRHDFRSGGGPFNTVHSSDSPESATREIEVVFFPVA